MSCPTASELRAYSERPDPTVARHVEGCASCARFVALAQREEAAIRAALPVEPPADFLAKTLAALDREEPSATPSRRSRAARSSRRRRDGPGGGAGLAAAAIALLGVAAVALIATRPGSPPGDSPAPPPVVGPQPGAPPQAPATPPPAPPRPAPPVAPPAPVVEPDEPVVAKRPDEPAPAPELPPVPAPAPVTPGPTPAPAPAPSTTQGEEVLALVRAGKLTVGGKPVAVGASLPLDAAIQNGTATTELASPGRARVLVAANARFTIKKGPRGEPVFTVEKGQVFARTDGAGDYALASADARAVPTGTAFLLGVESGRTRVATLEGSVRFESDKGTADVRAGFESEVAKGKAPALPRPAALAKALAWLPAEQLKASRPPAFEVVRSFAFEGASEGFRSGRVTGPGAHGSRGCLEGVPAPSDYARMVELEELGGAGVLSLEPDLWIEATVRVDRRAKVVLQVWDADRKENLARFFTVEPGTWTTIAAPLRDFGDASGKPRARPVGPGRATCFSIFAGESREELGLQVDDVRFLRQSSNGAR